MNKTMIIGRLTKTPELKQTSGGNMVKFSVAVNRYKDDTADFFDCIAWGKTADFISAYCEKGRLVYVEGEMHKNSYQKQDGTMGSNWTLTVAKLEALEKKQVSNGEAEIPSEKSQQSAFNNRNNANVVEPPNPFTETKSKIAKSFGDVQVEDWDPFTGDD